MKNRKSKKELKKLRRKQQRHSAQSPAIAAASKSETRRNELTNGGRDALRGDDNNESNPPLTVSGSKKRVRSIVEFVYPRDASNERKPFLFKLEETASVEAKRDRQTSQQRESGKRPNTSFESIEDILFPRAKKQLKRQKTEGSEDDNKVLEGSRPIIESSRDEEMEEGKLSGLSVEDVIRDKAGCRPRANSTDGELNLPRRGLCDERMVLEAHRWKNSFGHNPPKGFTNLGNSCFLNATLQCLAYLPTFSQTITSLPNSNTGAPNGRKPSKGQRITSMLSSLFRQVHGMNGVKIGGGAISPHAIVRAVPSLGSVGSRCGYKFRPGQQEDAHEFLVHLLDAMQDGELKAAGIDQNASGWRDRLPIPRLDETTFVNRIFGGYLRSQVQCTNCGYCSNTYDPFLDLSLEVNKKSSSSVAIAFAEFTRKEQLDSKNRWQCTGCKKHVCAKKQLTVFRPPLSLCIQLKRFTFGGGFGSIGSGWGFGNYTGKGMGMFGRGGSKISKPIDFPSELKLPLSDGRTCEYHLTGVVVHIGGSASSGHYTAFVKKPGGLNRHHQWYHMDDSFVEAVSEKTVLRQKDAYVLFYCRKEVKIEYPCPPPRGFVSAEAARESGIARARVRSSSLDKQRPVVVPNLSTTAIRSNDIFSAASPSKSSAVLGSNEKKLSGSSTVLSQASQASTEKERATFSRIKTVESRSPSTNKVVSDGERRSSESDSNDSSESRAPEKQKPVDQNGSSSSDGVSDDDSSSDDSSSTSDGNNDAASKTQTLNAKLQIPVYGDADDKTKKTSSKTRIVVDHGGAAGKLEVMLGPRRGSKTWKPQAASSLERGSQHELLGSVKVGKWDNDDDNMDDTIPFSSSEAQMDQRSNALMQLDKRKRSRKRKMYLDRWDSMLDEGKKKKVREKKEEPAMAILDPKLNPFHRIQSSMQRMNRGKAKGMYRQNMKKNSRGPRGRRTK